MEPMAREICTASEEWDLLVQIFVDDISAAAGHTNREAVTRLPWLLRKILLRELRAIELDVRDSKCRNFLVEWLISGLI